MDVEEKLKLITGVGEEVVTEPELRNLLETKNNPKPKKESKQAEKGT